MTPSPLAIPKLPPVGRCIYCLSTEGLTNEHIMPIALGGKLVLPKASCEPCRRITSEFERIVTRQMYWPLRLSLGLLGSPKHKRERPTHWKTIIIDGEREDALSVEVDKLPRTYIVFEYPPAGILTGAPPSDKSPELKIYLKGDQSKLNNFANVMGAGKLEFQFMWDWVAFNKILAKIAHGFAVSVLGFGGVEYLLPPLIVCDSYYFSYLIGGISDPIHELVPPNDIALNVRYIGGQPYVTVRTTIFGAKRFPTYEVIAGRITDFDLIPPNTVWAAQP